MGKTNDLNQQGMHEFVAISSRDAYVVLTKFDGSFDEGEGSSMGMPVRWKYPQNEEEIMVLGALNDENEKIWEWIDNALEHGKNVYVNGVGRIKTDGEFITREDM